jgi:signal transduction histidine kinase
METGDYFGEMAVFDGGPRSASATVIESGELTFLPADAVRDVLSCAPLLAAALVRDASLRMRDFNQRFLQELLKAERLTLVERLAKTIVHDFRNPLNVIGIASDLAAEPQATLEMRKNARDRIRRQVELLNRLMQELLDFTRATSASRILPRVSYASFLRDVILELESEAQRRGIDLVIESPLPEVEVRLDGPRLMRVFLNLAQNAFDELARRVDGRLTLGFEVVQQEVITRVADNGEGLPPEIADHLFEPFVTYGKAHGTGLGLAICDRIVGDHGGRIRVDNGSEGGAVFEFSLPLARPGETDWQSAVVDSESDIEMEGLGPESTPPK